MLLVLAWAALRRRPFSVLCTLLLGVAWASLLRVPVPAVLLGWIVLSLLTLEVLLVFEPAILELAGCRALTRGEHDRLAAWMHRCNVTVRVADDPAAWVGGALRTVVISRGALDMIDDRGLYGLLGQAATLQRAPFLLRAIVVWLGNLPLLAAWCATACLGQFGRWLAVALGSALVLPMLLWSAAFVVWVGRLLSAALVALVGAVLVSTGQPALGLSLWLAWAAVPGLRALLAWESRQAHAEADRASVSAGFGCYLLHGLEALMSIEAISSCGALRLLVPPGAPVHKRAQWVWRAISGTLEQ
jgi:hypothetical protein